VRNIPIITDERLQEKGFGMLEGTTEKERIQTWGENWRKLELGAESNENFQKRSFACVKEAFHRFPNKSILFVSQGATINQLLKKLLNDPSFDLRFTNTSLTILERREEKWECTLLNCSKHLGKEIFI
jgi:2,3-bisphosphoglycerate-dependent phosphoglycerate mutase